MKNTQFLRSTKIVATLGPSSNTENKIKKLIFAGVNVFRLNFSHGSHEDHLSKINIIRRIETKFKLQLGILADLQGPKFRIGKVEDNVKLKVNDLFILDKEKEIGSRKRAYLGHNEIYKSIKTNSIILIDDGKIKLKVLSKKKDILKTKVLVGGNLSSNKGVNLPNLILDTKPITKKDRNDLTFILENEIDWIALSFVQKVNDVKYVKKIIKNKKPLISKIEKPSALNDLDQIIELSDGIMVARGDLGVELPPSNVPGIQKNIIMACRVLGKPVIVATQMLESMISTPVPTRAEASDVATAVFDGADAVMLSAETAVGQYPVDSVNTMSNILEATEMHIKLHPHDSPRALKKENSIYHAVSNAAVNLAETVNAKAIVAFTASGKTAFRISRERPDLLLIVMTPENIVRRKLSLLWGARSFLSKVQGYEAAIKEARETIKINKLAKVNENIIVVAGMPFGVEGTTNSIRVVTI
ncbi:MAG: pyruvate kinase [Alphaproteobacteria bacterium]|nr:MAG: pyruvate kinase [Alphaproteobacteria bacterium]